MIFRNPVPIKLLVLTADDKKPVKGIIEDESGAGLRKKKNLLILIVILFIIGLALCITRTLFFNLASPSLSISDQGMASFRCS
jgi:hypothetical protein